MPGDSKTASRVLLSFGDSVVALVGLEESDNTSLGLLGLDLSALKSNGSIVAETCVGCIVEVGQVEGIVRESLTV